jgi:hypothetical protein
MRDLHNLYSSPDITTVVSQGRFDGWGIKEIRNMYIILIRILEEKSPCGKAKWENNIKM